MQEIVINSHEAVIVESKEHFYDSKRFTPLIRKRRMTLKEFANTLTPEVGDSVILPVNTRYSKDCRKSKILVLEDQPRVRTITVNMEMEATVERMKKTGKYDTYGIEKFIFKNKPPYRFSLSFPYVVYIIKMQRSTTGDFQENGVWVYYRLSPISGMSDYLIKANLLNISDSDSICLGDSNFRRENNATITAIDLCQNIIDKFWLNIFNKDYTGHYEKYSEVQGMTDFLTWAYHTEQDPMFIYRVPWLKHNLTLGEQISKIESAELRRSGDNYESDYMYRLTNSFYRNNQIPTPNVSDRDRSDLKSNFFRNATSEFMLDDGIISVGDEVMYNKELVYIADYLCENGTSYATHIEFEKEAGERFIVKINASLKRLLNYHIKLPDINEIEINGQNLKVGDLLKLTYQGYDSFKEVKRIRRAIDGKMEALLNNDYYLIENTPFEVLDLSNVEFDGVKLEKGETYRLFKESDDSSPISSYIYDTKYMGFYTRARHINLHFLTTSGSDIYIKLDDLHSRDRRYSLLTEIKKEEYPVLRIETNLITNHKTKKVYVIAGKGFMGSDSYAYQNYDMGYSIKNLLTDNGTKLYIPSFNIDIDFKVGDTVVVADWKNPGIMTTIFQISSFEFDFRDPENHRSSKVLWVNLTDINKKITHRIPFINISNGHINIGLMRHIIASYGGITSGDKIKANVAGIPNFPKKDTNTVIGFISDAGTKHPLMFCSNLCTQWAAPDILAKFEVIKRKTVKWIKSKNADPVKKLKIQCGDMFTEQYAGRHKLFPDLAFVGFPNGSTGLRSFPVSRDYGIRYNDNIRRIVNFETKEPIRWGFPIPRYSNSQLAGMYMKKIYPNMLGGYNELRRSRVKILEDWDNV